MSNYVYSSSPHVKSPRTTKMIMIDVCIALIPACIMGIVYFGWGALLILAISAISAVLSEWVFLLCCKKSFKEILQQFDYTSLVTGLLIGMNLYANSKWYVAILASVFAVIIVKMLFGGTGKNIVNPAIAGRVFAFIAFGAAFGGTFSVTPESPSVSQISVAGSRYIQAGATPLQSLYDPSIVNNLNCWDLLLGTGVQGCIGEVCKLALILGGIYLVVRGVLNFRWPLVYIAVTGVVSVIIAWIDGCSALTNPTSSFIAVEFTKACGVFFPSILSGGLILGAIFMATDYVTTPNTKLGNYIYFVLLGILTAVMRRAVKGEVVSFVILLMNLLVPLFDLYIRRKPFGYVKPQKSAKEAK